MVSPPKMCSIKICLMRVRITTRPQARHETFFYLCYCIMTFQLCAGLGIGQIEVSPPTATGTSDSLIMLEGSRTALPLIWATQADGRMKSAARSSHLSALGEMVRGCETKYTKFHHKQIGPRKNLFQLNPAFFKILKSRIF